MVVYPLTLGVCGREVLTEDTICKNSEVLREARCYVRQESRTYIGKGQEPKAEKVGRKCIGRAFSVFMLNDFQCQSVSHSQLLKGFQGVKIYFFFKSS